MVKGELTFPGDKSISHQALMLAALANGESRISILSTGAGVQSTRKCLEACGIEIRDVGNDVIVKGGRFSDPKEPLDCGNSGTTTRLLWGLLSGQGINATFIGDKSLSSCPMNRVLKKNGFKYVGQGSEIVVIRYEVSREDSLDQNRA
ncbi:hypothetical protein JYT44_01070 [Caldithrix abyssi]|nr:hypothetical protein [Caldithrix abyssi]